MCSEILIRNFCVWNHVTISAAATTVLLSLKLDHNLHILQPRNFVILAVFTMIAYRIDFIRRGADIILQER